MSGCTTLGRCSRRVRFGGNLAARTKLQSSLGPPSQSHTQAFTNFNATTSARDQARRVARPSPEQGRQPCGLWARVRCGLAYPSPCRAPVQGRQPCGLWTRVRCGLTWNEGSRCIFSLSQLCLMNIQNQQYKRNRSMLRLQETRNRMLPCKVYPLRINIDTLSQL